MVTNDDARPLLQGPPAFGLLSEVFFLSVVSGEGARPNCFLLCLLQYAQRLPFLLRHKNGGGKNIDCFLSSRFAARYRRVPLIRDKSGGG